MEASKDKIIPVIFGLKGYALTKKEINFIKNNTIFGFIIFKRNILNFSQLRILINHLKKLSLIDPIIMIDHEGGRVNRFSNLFSQRSLSAKYFGELYSKDKKKFFKIARFFVNFNSRIFNFLGINTVAYPVLDLKYKKTHHVIGDRSFSSDPNKVKKISKVFIKEYQKRGINCISKHVPGHGLSEVDSHYDLPVVRET